MRRFSSQSSPRRRITGSNPPTASMALATEDARGRRTLLGLGCRRRGRRRRPARTGCCSRGRSHAARGFPPRPASLLRRSRHRGRCSAATARRGVVRGELRVRINAHHRPGAVGGDREVQPERDVALGIGDEDDPGVRRRNFARQSLGAVASTDRVRARSPCRRRSPGRAIGVHGVARRLSSSFSTGIT